MNLQEQGFRFVLRGRSGLWTHPLDMTVNDVDCTDMNDEEFEIAVRAAMRRAHDWVGDTDPGGAECRECGETFIGHSWRTICRLCAAGFPPEVDEAHVANARMGFAGPGLLTLLTQAEQCIASGVRIEQTAPEEPPCPVSLWDYEADQLAAEIRAAIRKATREQA